MASSFANADDGATKPSKCIIDGEEFYELYSVEDLMWFSAELNVGENLDINAILRNDIEINDSWIPVTAFKAFLMEMIIALKQIIFLLVIILEPLKIYILKKLPLLNSIGLLPIIVALFPIVR